MQHRIQCRKSTTGVTVLAECHDVTERFTEGGLTKELLSEPRLA